MKKVTIIIEDDEKGLVQNPLSGVGSPYQYWGENYDPCEGCNNNPKNNPNASGVCHCTLPYMYGKQRITY